VRVLNEKFVMGFGGRGRGGSTSRKGSNEGSKEKKESKPSEGKISGDEIRKLVAKFLKELASNTNPKKAPRLLNKISEETVRALGFMSKLKYVTDQEFVDKYIEAEARRKEWFETSGWEFTPNVDPDKLPLLSYDTVPDVYGQTVQIDDKHDAFVTFMGTQEGPLRTAEYDKMICNALLAAFGKKTTNSTIKMFADIQIEVNGPEHILGDVITFVSKLATVNHELGTLEPDEMQQVIEVLNNGLSKIAPALAVGMKTATEGKDYSVEQWCEILVEKASKRVEATDEFANWENPKGNQQLSDAERLRLNNLEKEVAQLKKENAQLKATKQGTKSTSSTSVAAAGNTGCFTCGQEGHRADRCPNKPGTPAKPKTAGAKSAGQSNKKVSFTKLQLDSAVQQAVKATVDETVAALAKNGWTKP
jgi:hypothetical protein